MNHDPKKPRPSRDDQSLVWLEVEAGRVRLVPATVAEDGDTWEDVADRLLAQMLLGSHKGKL